VSAASQMTIDERSQIQWVSEHARQRFSERGGELRNLFAVWYEARPINYPRARGQAYARYHVGDDLVLIAAWGKLLTVIKLADCPPAEQRYVREQLED